MLHKFHTQVGLLVTSSYGHFKLKISTLTPSKDTPQGHGTYLVPSSVGWELAVAELSATFVVACVVARVVALVDVLGEAVVTENSVSLPVMQNSSSAKFWRKIFQS